MHLMSSSHVMRESMRNFGEAINGGVWLEIISELHRGNPIINCGDIILKPRNSVPTCTTRIVHFYDFDMGLTLILYWYRCANNYAKFLCLQASSCAYCWHNAQKNELNQFFLSNTGNQRA